MPCLPRAHSQEDSVSRHCFAGFLAALMCLPSASAAEKTRISLEIVMERGFPVTSAQQWTTAIGQLGMADVRIRQSMPGDDMKIEKTGTAAAPAVRVIG